MFGRSNPQSELFRRVRRVYCSSYFRRGCMMFTLLCCMMAAACASSGGGGGDVSFDLAGVMTTCVQKIISDIMQMVTAVLPITVTLLGMGIGVSYAIRFIKKIVGRAG